MPGLVCGSCRCAGTLHSIQQRELVGVLGRGAVRATDSEECKDIGTSRRTEVDDVK